MQSNIILYVENQKRSRDFYHAVLQIDPELDVPGMTEFRLSIETVLGLMPAAGIKKLLGDTLPDPQKGHGIPRAELYVTVDDPETFHKRSLKAGGKELSPICPRDWGDEAAYSLDLDGHVLAFARKISFGEKP